MSFRYQKRVRTGKNEYVNVSNSGVSYSRRTKYGSIGTRGFSIKTGIPGLTFRKSWGKGSSGLAVLATVGVIYLVVIVVYNLIRLLYHLLSMPFRK